MPTGGSEPETASLNTDSGHGCPTIPSCDDGSLMLYSMGRRMSVATVAIVVALASNSALAQQRINVDFTHTIGPMNRAIFGLEGIPKVFRVARSNPRLMETFLRLNPAGTIARMETWIGYLEPENDNDDPMVTDWSRLDPLKMTRFIEPDQAERFQAFLGLIGVELMPLYCYNTEWLDSGREDDKVRDKQEWAEFAVAATTYWNQITSIGPDVRYVEIWNEPNMPMFSAGTRSAYFELFETAARRMHEAHPDVMVGGPALSPAPWTEPDSWYRDFLRDVGKHADFVTHHIYHDGSHGVDEVVREVVEKSDLFRSLPGKEAGLLALTETDAWFDGWAKTQYLLERHFAFAEIQDRLLAVMHFTSLAYNELGDYVFGVMYETGAPRDDHYSAFWIMRNLMGEQAPVSAGPGPIRVMATRHVNVKGQALLSAVLWNSGQASEAVDLALKVPDGDDLNVARVDRIVRGGERRVLAFPADDFRSGTNTLTLEPGEAVAVSLYRGGERHLPFADLNDQEMPAVLLTTDHQRIELDDRFTLTAQVVNTTGADAAGRLRLADLPTGWTVRQAPPATRRLAPGERAERSFSIAAATAPPTRSRMALTAHSGRGDQNHGVAPVAIWLAVEGDRRAASLPVDLVFMAPGKTDRTPDKE